MSTPSWAHLRGREKYAFAAALEEAGGAGGGGGGGNAGGGIGHYEVCVAETGETNQITVDLGFPYVWYCLRGDGQHALHINGAAVLPQELADATSSPDLVASEGDLPLCRSTILRVLNLGTQEAILVLTGMTTEGLRMVVPANNDYYYRVFDTTTGAAVENAFVAGMPQS